MMACVPKEAEGSLVGPGATVGKPSDDLAGDVSSGPHTTLATSGELVATTAAEKDDTTVMSDDESSKEKKRLDTEEEKMSAMSDSDHHNELPEGLSKFKVDDSVEYRGQGMLHYLGRQVGDEAGFGVGNNGEITRERLRQLTTARLAEQGRVVMQEANFLFQREAAAMQQKVNVTVASKPLYPIAAPQRIRMPKQPARFADPLLRHPLYDGPLNLVNRPVLSAHPYSTVHHHSMDGAADLSKPLDLSMKSDRLACVSRAPKSMVDPMMMSIANTEIIAKQSLTACSNGHEVALKVTSSAQTMYRPPPMMSYGKPLRHSNCINPTPPEHRQHSLGPMDGAMSQSQLHPLASIKSVGLHIQPHRSALKRPAPVMARSASEIPLKRAVRDSTLGMTKEHLTAASSSCVPTSVNMQRYPEASRAAMMAYERGRSRAVAYISQQSQEPQLRITDVRSLGSRAATNLPNQVPTSTQSRPRSTKTGAAPVFHHIHHHHHHHHVPQPDEELLRPNSNGTPGVHARAGVPPHIGVLAQAGAAGPGNGLPAHEIPIHRLTGHVVPGHDVASHNMAAPNMASTRGDRMHGVLIKHTSTPVSTMTSPHLRRAHYQTRRRKRSNSPPTLNSISGISQLRRDSASVVASAPGHAHQHARAVSPLKLVASSIAAGAKMNELLKPLDGPDQPASSGHSGVNNNNNKVRVTDKLALPLRVDIPDDRAFVSHLGGVYAGQANPVPLVRQVSNAANITKCLTSEANSSPKKSNSSGNESPTMPVLTPQSVYSPCFATDSTRNLTHMSSSMEPPPTSSPMFYNALTLPLYPRKQDAPTEAQQKLSRGKDESPPNLNETSPEQRVPDQRVPIQINPEMTGRLQRQIDSYILDAAAAVDKNKRERRCIRENSMQEQTAAYPRYVNAEYQRELFEKRDKSRKRHMHLYGLKASMEKTKKHQSKKARERSHLAVNQDDRNIFAELMLQRKWYEAKTSANEARAAKVRQQQQVDVIDLTTSPSSSPAPSVLGSIASKHGAGGSGGIGKKKSETPALRKKESRYDIMSVIEEGRTVSVSEAIEAVFAAHMPVVSSDSPNTEHGHPDAASKELDLEARELRRVPHREVDQKDHPPKLVKVQASPIVSSASTAPVANACAVITSAKSSSVLPPFTTTNDIKTNAFLADSCTPLSSAHKAAPFLVESPSLENSPLSTVPVDASQPSYYVNSPAAHVMVSSTSSLPPHLRYSPTEKTFSHDPRKKLLAAMSVQTPTVTASAVSPASIAASLSSTVSPSSGRSTPSKSSYRKRSLEISRLENTSSYVAEIPKRRQNVDLLTDPALLDREERALQRAMKRFNEMEKREKVTPTDAQAEPQLNGKRNNRLIVTKHSPVFRRGRGRGRKFLGYQILNQTQKGRLMTFRGLHRYRRGFSREMHGLTSQGGRSSFQDFVPLVLEERTRHSLATRSSARERKVYHKNARYEMEIEKEERKHLERKRQKRSVSGSTSGEEDAASLKSKPGPGRRRRGAEDASTKSCDASSITKEEPPKLKSDLDPSFAPQQPTSDVTPEDPPTDEGVAKSPSLDAPLHVVLDPTNHTKMKFMTSSAYELHRKDSGKENKGADREEVAVKPGGKRKFKSKHLGPALLTVDTNGRQDDNMTIKSEVLESLPTISPPQPNPIKVVRPHAPAEMKRLMVNKKLGETILHRAARLAYDDVAIYCIDYDVVDINAKDNAGYTPLHECCVHGRLRVALHLLQHGADVNASASDGTRPIHDAVDNNWLALVRLLLTYGADPLIATYSGRTTIKLARTKAMKTFIIGYLSDINGAWHPDEDDPYQSNLDLRWHLTGTHSFDTNDLAVCDIFQDVPETEKKPCDGEFLFEVSDSPHLTSYNIRLPNDQRARNWLLLPDVTKQLSITRTDFLGRNRTLRRATITTDEFNAAIGRSQLNFDPPQESQMVLDETSGGYVVEMLELTSELRKTLHIDEEYV